MRRSRLRKLLRWRPKVGHHDAVNRRDHSPAIIATAIAAFGLGIVVTLGFRLSAEEGAAWLAAAGTVAAVAAAVYAGIWAKQAYDLEEKRESARIKSELSKQADLFAAWPTTQNVHLESTGWRQSTESTRHVIAFRNASALPVTDVRATVDSGGYVFDTVRLPMVPPSDVPLMEPFVDAHQQLPYIDSPLSVSLQFIDAAGNLWVREYGRPPRLLESPHP